MRGKKARNWKLTLFYWVFYTSVVVDNFLVSVFKQLEEFPDNVVQLDSKGGLNERGVAEVNERIINNIVIKGNTLYGKI